MIRIVMPHARRESAPTRARKNATPVNETAVATPREIYLARLRAVRPPARSGLFDDMLLDVREHARLKPGDYTGVRDRLVQLAHGVMLLEPRVRLEGAILIDQLCTSLLRPPPPRVVDEHLLLAREGIGEPRVREAVIATLREILRSPHEPDATRRFEETLAEAPRLSATARAGYLDELARIVHEKADPRVRYERLVAIRVETQRLPLRAALAAQKTIAPMLAATDPRHRRLSPIVCGDMRTRLHAGESAEEIKRLPSVVQALRAPVVDADEIGRLAARVEPSRSRSGLRENLRALRVGLILAAQTPNDVRATILTHLLEIARRCQYPLTFSEYENVTMAYPKPDDVGLVMLERMVHAENVRDEIAAASRGAT